MVLIKFVSKKSFCFFRNFRSDPFLEKLSLAVVLGTC